MWLGVAGSWQCCWMNGYAERQSIPLAWAIARTCPKIRFAPAALAHSLPVQTSLRNPCAGCRYSRVGHED